MKCSITTNSNHGISPILYSLPRDIYGVERGRGDALTNLITQYQQIRTFRRAPKLAWGSDPKYGLIQQLQLPVQDATIQGSKRNRKSYIALVSEAGAEVREQLLPLVARAAIGAGGVDDEDEVAAAAGGDGGGGGAVGREADGGRLGVGVRRSRQDPRRPRRRWRDHE
jgi:hypothetical protein